jgi:vitamin B12 transporter
VFGNVPGTVTVRGVEIALESSQSDSWSATLDYTYNHSIDPSTQQQVANVPTNLVKAGFDYHPAGQPWGANLTLNHFGKTIATGLWDGSEAYGNDTIVNLAGRVFLDSQRHQRLDLSVQNLFNRTYATGLGNATRDADGTEYTYWNLGVPRNARIAYTYRF